MTTSKLSKSSLIPSFLRSAVEGYRPLTLTFNDISDTNALSTASFMYDPADVPLKSTQQLNVDWSLFENHTFFMSAEAKVNLTFEQIINGFPFDGSRKDVEEFFERLSGFDKWVFEQFPKYRGELMFSGSTGGSGGSYIIINDSAGALYPELAKNKTGESVLNPKDGASLSIELQLFVPSITNDNQVICQKLSGSTQGFSLYLSASTSTSTAEACFSVMSGTTALTVPATITKGSYNHLCVTFNRDGGVHYLESFVDSELHETSQTRAAFGDLDIDDSQMIIGSGTLLSLDTTTWTPRQTFSGSIDELRIFHSVRTVTQQNAYATKALYSTPELRLYYRFNEPQSLSTAGTQADSIVIDSSGNALHSTVTNFTGTLRSNSATNSMNPMINEKDETIPILFPAHADVIALNVDLLSSASSYDKANPNLITRLVPPHYLLEGAFYDGYQEPEGDGGNAYGGNGIPGEGRIGSVQIFLSMLYIYARFFDDLKLYVDAFSTLGYADYDPHASMPDNFLRDTILKHGFNLPILFNDSTIEQYIRAENIDFEISTSETPLKNVQQELMRRILVNLPDVIKSKGTQHSIKAFLRAIGIDPDNSMRIREYGGPTTQQLSSAREKKYDISAMVEFSTGSYAATGFLTASRTEVGWPYAKGTYVFKDQFPPHGISNDSDDGILTSGSWTVEATYRYNRSHIAAMTSVTQSLLRMNFSGSNLYNQDISLQDPLLIANLLAFSSSIDPHVVLYIAPVPRYDPDPWCFKLSLPLLTGTFFDGDKWTVSFGCERNDAFDSNVSSSYFLRVASANNGEISTSLLTSSYFDDAVRTIGATTYHNVLRTIIPLTGTLGSTVRDIGPTLSIGTSSIVHGPQGDTYFLNTDDDNTKVPLEARATNFEGMVSNVKFWSKAIDEREWLEHVKNYKSCGVIDPLVNYNFGAAATGSFEKLRMHAMTKQDVRRANATASLGPLEEITFIDFSQNDQHMSGTGFPINKDCVKSEVFGYSYISPRFDEACTDEKIRIRSFLNQALVDETPWAEPAPRYELVKSEQPTDDNRFSIDFSLTDALDRDIITMFATLESMDNALGDPALMFSPDYPDVERMRDIYFNRLQGKLNFKAFHEFFHWFDSTIGTFIEQLIPKRTNFKGVNFTIESHMLERSKSEYFFNEMYLGASDRSRLNSAIYLQMIAGTCRKF